MLMAYVPEVILDPGETEALALARSLPDARVLLDDESARAKARRLKLRVTGTLGVVAQAHRSGILSLPDTELLLQEIAVRPDIWINARLCEQLLEALRKA
jgi:predicted nucleic acid-binding protein